MKRVLLTLTLFFSAAALSQNLDQSFQQEYVYLTSQKEALQRQKAQMEASFAERLRKSKAQVGEMQRQLTQLTATNDERHEELLLLEKQKKELLKRGHSLESTFKKASETLAEFKRQLRFENTKDKEKPNVVIPETLAVSDLSPIFAEANTLLRSSARVEVFQGYYLDQKDELKQGEVLRLGRVAAFLNQSGEKVLLGPSGTGLLKTLEPAQGGQAYVFENMAETARIQKAATFVEHLADASPIIFLSLMLMMVAGLFVVLVRI